MESAPCSTSPTTTTEPAGSTSGSGSSSAARSTSRSCGRRPDPLARRTLVVRCRPGAPHDRGSKRRRGEVGAPPSGEGVGEEAAFEVADRQGGGGGEPLRCHLLRRLADHLEDAVVLELG